MAHVELKLGLAQSGYLSADRADRLADERAEAAIQMLLDGLGVESLAELRAAVAGEQVAAVLMEKAETIERHGIDALRLEGDDGTRLLAHELRMTARAIPYWNHA